ncbi:hypothetical protein PCH_Pc21g00980 [Penicillium rubens Wisconsin 54-1255]|uniref:Uncharacterized protein n=1 Tax=Penicillium rubens (strain ATCC 28089 / DSM 1075 / NRRL 1951 / Wisconsin 54-1255) TaxID=500485 RepID=B6HHW6_PENRW|nr:hypothetical protein PCH_Pc21g00980 [Penicillium rubens Wisconsin 54-1255]
MSCMRWLAPHSGWAGAGDPNEGLMISMNHFPVEKVHWAPTPSGRIKATGHFISRGNYSERVSATPMQLCRCDGAKQDRRQGDPDVRFDPEVAMAMGWVSINGDTVLDSLE